jgi:hypothetical protein
MFHHLQDYCDREKQELYPELTSSFFPVESGKSLGNIVILLARR